MNVLVVCEHLYYPYTEMTGMKGIYELQKKLSRKFNITILTGLESKPTKELILWVKSQKKHNINFEFVISKTIILRKIKTFLKITSLLKKGSYDILHDYTSIPFLLNFNLVIKKRFKLLKMFSSIVTNYGLLSSNRLLFLSPFNCLILSDLGNFNYFKRKKVKSVLIPISVSKHKFRVPPSSKVKSFVFIGPLKGDKGAFIYIDLALKLLKLGYKELRFNIVTYGKNIHDPDYDNRKKRLLQKVSDYEKKFRLYEQVVDIKSVFSKSDVLIYPLKRFKGTLVNPLTLIEAMAAGRIIVSSKFRGWENLIKSGFNGFVFDVKKNGDLLKTVLKLLKSRNLKKYGLNARKTFSKNFCLENNVKKLIKLYMS